MALPQLTDAELDTQLNTCFRRMFDPEFDVSLTFDHTTRLLEQAAVFENDNDVEVTAMFIMLWIDHRVNLITRVMLRRTSLADDQAVLFVRKFSLREKLTCLWPLLGMKTFPNDILSVITTMEEFRNSFVHFKWVGDLVNTAAEDRAWRAINRLQEVIDTLLVFEDEYVYYGQRERIALAVERLK